MQKDAKIYVAGHRGMAGSAILRRLQKEGYTNILGKTSKELDLRNQAAVHAFFENEKPDYVFLAAAKVGGIAANNIYRADFIYENLMIESNVIHAAYLNSVTKLLFLGSSCIYPKLAPQPLKEEYLLSGYLENSNQPYAISKIAGIEMCQAYRAQYNCNFISVMPTNLYGPNDNYDLTTSHVLPALLRKFMMAKNEGAEFVTVWGTGKPRREFMHADDLAAASIFLMNNYNEAGFLNVGIGEDIPVSELAEMISGIVGYKGEIRFDTTKPDGAPRKLMDVTKINNLGWKATIGLREGINRIYKEMTDKQW